MCTQYSTSKHFVYKFKGEQPDTIQLLLKLFLFYRVLRELQMIVDFVSERDTKIYNFHNKIENAQFTTSRNCNIF